MVYYIQPSLASDDSIVRCQECFLYTYTGVGLSALLVSTKYTIEYARVKAILINSFISKESIKI